MIKTYHLFISHSWGYSDAYDGIVTLFENAPLFAYKNHSVPKHDPIHTSGTDRELAEAIYRKMQGCHAVIIIAGVYGTYSKWIKKEISIAKNEFPRPKPIIAVKPYATTRVSTVVKDAADQIVSWNSKAIISAVRQLS